MTESDADPWRFTLTNSGQEQGHLLYQGTDAGLFAGVELVAYFPVHGVGWLVVTDCDSPFEETVYLHLLAPDMTLIETRALGGAYTSGIVEGMERLGPNRFRILFPSREHPQLITIAPQTTGLLRKTTHWLHVTPG